MKLFHVEVKLIKTTVDQMHHRVDVINYMLGFFSNKGMQIVNSGTNSDEQFRGGVHKKRSRSFSSSWDGSR